MTDQQATPTGETDLQGEMRSWNKRHVPRLALLALLALSVAVWLFYRDVSRERERRIFKELVNESVNEISGKLERLRMILQGGGGFVLASEMVTREEWRAFYEYSRISGSFPSIQAMGFIPVVRSADLPRHVAQVRAEGFPDYTVRAAGDQDEYAPLLYAEPLNAANQEALGHDWFSEPVRREAMTRARDTGSAALSGRLQIYQDQDGASEPGFVLFGPLYAGNVPAQSVDERRAAIRGFMYAAFRVQDFMDTILPRLNHEIAFLCYDGADAMPSDLVFDSHADPSAVAPMFFARRALALYGHQWTLDFRTAPAFDAGVDQYSAWIVLAGGVASSLLIFLMIKMLETSGVRAFALAREMTAALRESEARCRKLDDNLPVGVALIGANMEILAANATMRQWFSIPHFADNSPCYTVCCDPPRTVPCPECPVVQAFQDGQTHIGEREITGPAGRLTLLIRALPLFGPDGKVAQVHETVEDISQRKQAERELKASEMRLRAITDSAKDAVIMLESHGVISFWNPAAETIFGYIAEEAVGKNVHTLLTPDGYHGAYPRDFSHFHGHEACKVVEYPAVRKDRQEIMISISVSSIRLDNECYVVGIVRDITEAKKKEEILRASEARFRSAMNYSPLGMALVAPDGRFLEVNAALCRKSGYSEGELLRTSIHSVTHVDDQLADEQQIRQLLSGEIQTYRVEKRYIHKGGQPIWGLLSASLTRKEDGSPDYFIYQILDITARKETEARLLAFNAELEERVENRTRELAEQNKQIEEQRQVFDLVFEQALAGFWDWTVLTDTFLMSPRFKAVLGYDEHEVPSTMAALKSLVHPEDLPLIFEQFQAHVENRGRVPYMLELRYLHKDGSLLWITCTGMVIEWMDDGRPVRMVGCHIDITAKKRMEQELASARDAAEAASREKSRFLANMSHEIRTPMNAVLGFAQVLERDPALTPEQTERIRSINRAGLHLLSLINNILDMAKIESGMSVLSIRAFSLHDMLDGLQIMFRSRADAKGLRLNMEREPGMPFCVLADEVKLQQVFVNLIGNAVKFTHKGGVAVRVRTESAEGGEKALRLVVEVEDSGPGISATEQKRIFHPFIQGETGNLAGGTGLGLPISRKLVEMMGGSLTVQSEVGRGSCFRFDVLLEPTDALPDEAEIEASPIVAGLEPGSGPWRILVVDDVQNNRDLLSYMLQPVGFEVREARNGEEALRAFEEWSPHAVLMDMRMPVMDGYEATRRIKATVAGRDIPVIAVTASAFRDTEDKIRATGVSAYLRKPFRATELFEVLGQCLGLRYVHVDVPTRASQRALTPQAMSVFPQEMVHAMREAVAEGDMTRLMELIEQVAVWDESAARGLKLLADRYDYATLAELLG